MHENKTRLVYLCGYQTIKIVLLIQVLVYLFSVCIVDIHASNLMACELANGIVIIARWIPESFSSDRSASS